MMSDSQVIYELVMQRGPTPGQLFRLAHRNMTIGRDTLSDILINDPEVSRQHALLIATGAGDYMLQDLGSTNGTFIDGRRVHDQPQRLREGQLIAMGSAVALLVRRSQVEEPYPPDARPSPQPEAQQTESAAERPVTSGAPERPQSLPLREGKADRTDPHSPGRPAARPDSPHTLDRAEHSPSDGRPQTAQSQELTPNLILGLVLLLLCCGVGLILFLVFLGGDWLLRLAGIVP